MSLRKAIKNRRTMGDNRAARRSKRQEARTLKRETRLNKRAERQAKRQEERTKRKGKGSPVLEKLMDVGGSIANTLLGRDGSQIPASASADFGSMAFNQPQSEPLITSRMVGETTPPPTKNNTMLYVIIAGVVIFLFRKKLFK